MKNKPKSNKSLAEWAGAENKDITQLTVLFTDIIGSTKLSNEKGDEKWIDILINHFKHARTLLDHYKHFEIKIIGDSFMVAFHNAFEAVNFAIKFLKDTGDENIKIRVGINSGAVRIIENDIYGNMVNYAARVTKWQKIEGIALSEYSKEHFRAEIGNEWREFLEEHINQFDDYDEERPVFRLDCDRYWHRLTHQKFPALEEIKKEKDTLKYQIIQANREDLQWFARIEKDAYGRYAIPREVLQSWYSKNPTGFFIIKDNDESVGHMDILPIHPAKLQLLLDGKIDEHRIDKDDLFSLAEKSEIQDLYIESVIVSPPSGLNRTAIFRALLSNFELNIAKICNPTNLTNIYGLGVTPSGKNFMNALGFEEMPPNSNKHIFFKANYSTLTNKIRHILGK